MLHSPTYINISHSTLPSLFFHNLFFTAAIQGNWKYSWEKYKFTLYKSVILFIG